MGLLTSSRLLSGVFHEIKDLSIKNKCVSRKLDDMEAKGIPQNATGVLWTEEEKMSMVECLQRKIKLMDKMKKKNEKNIKHL